MNKQERESHEIGLGVELLASIECFICCNYEELNIDSSLSSFRKGNISPWVHLYRNGIYWGKVGLWSFCDKAFISDHSMTMFFGWPKRIGCKKHELKNILEKKLNREENT